MGWGTLDESFIKTMDKLERLIGELGKTREAIVQLQEVMVKTDKQNRKLQVIGLLISGIGAVDIVIRILSFVHH